MRKLTEEEREKLREGIQKLENDRAAREAEKSNGPSKGFGATMGLLFMIIGIFQILKVVGGILPGKNRDNAANTFSFSIPNC